MTVRRLALGVLLALSLVAGAGAAPWTVEECGDDECCSWSGDTDGASDTH